MSIKTYVIHHVVMGPDINHHGTLFAGQGAKWFVEAGFIAAANLTSPESTVCVNVHGMTFKRPVPSGDIIRYESKVVLSGRSRLVAYVKAVRSNSEEFVVDGFLTFVHVDQQGRAIPHDIIIEAVTADDIDLQKRALALPK